MKKIIFYTENYVFGGLEKFLFDSLLYISKKHDVLILFNKENIRIKTFAENNNIKHKELDIKNKIFNIDEKSIIKRAIRKLLYFLGLLHLKNYYNFLSNYFILHNVLSSYKDYDNLFIVNGGYPGANSCRIISIVARKLRFKNIIMSVLSYPLDSDKYKINIIEKKLNKLVKLSVNKFIPNSKNIMYGLNKLFEFDLEKINIIYTGIKIDDIKNFVKEINIKNLELKKSDDEIWIGMLAYLGFPKNQIKLIEAMKIVRLKYQNVKCLIVGEGPYENNLKLFVENNNLDQQVFFSGKVDYEKTLEIYSFLDMCVFISDHEGLPYAITEAMSQKKVVIASNVGGISEQIEDNESGFLLNKNDENLIAEKICFLIENRSLWENLENKAYLKAKEKFSLEVMLEKIDKLII